MLPSAGDSSSPSQGDRRQDTSPALVQHLLVPNTLVEKWAPCVWVEYIPSGIGNAFNTVSSAIVYKTNVCSSILWPMILLFLKTA